MEFLIGIQFNDFVLLASDRRKSRSILTMKDDADKMYKLSEHNMMITSGEGADDVNFSEYIQRNIKLQILQTDIEPTIHNVANFTRHELAKSLRTRHMYAANMLIAGWDSNQGCSLYSLDYLGSLVKVPFGCHGHASAFALSALDRFYRPDMNINEAVQLLSVILKDIQKRFVVNIPKLLVRAVGREGISMINPELTVN
uniref:Proteasome subunit beta n=1 Tax=Henneguya salminicola TaxID=69463 RepID=A0A6G3MJ93_HENSL